MAIPTSVLRTCKGIWTRILCMSDKFSKCWSIRTISLLLSPKNNSSTCSFCMLMRSLLGCGFHEISKAGIYPKVTLCIHAHSSHVYPKDVISYAVFGCDCSVVHLAELQELQGKFAVSSPSVCRVHKIAVLWLVLSRGGGRCSQQSCQHTFLS